MHKRAIQSRNERRLSLEAYQKEITGYILGTTGTIATVVAIVTTFLGVIGQ